VARSFRCNREIRVFEQVEHLPHQFHIFSFRQKTSLVTRNLCEERFPRRSLKRTPGAVVGYEIRLSSLPSYGCTERAIPHVRHLMGMGVVPTFPVKTMTHVVVEGPSPVFLNFS